MFSDFVLSIYMSMFSKIIAKKASKGSNLILLSGVVALGLTSCSSDVTRFALQDANLRQASNAQNTNTANSVQQSPLAPLTVTNSQAPQTAPSAPNSNFTASIPTRVASTPATNNFMYNRNPDKHIVSTGDTLYNISKRFGITVEALRNANGFNQNSTISIGQSINLPRNNTSNVSYAPRVTPSNVMQEINTAPVQSTTLQRKIIAPTAVKVNSANYAPSSSGIHIVQPKETLYSISRAYNMKVSNLTALNGLSVNQGLRIGQRLRTNGATAQPSVTPAKVVPASVVRPVVKPQTVAAVAPSTNTSSGRFRWPVSGRVISEYGKKPDGRRNDGINIAVPPGTVVKAAENGVVAYAGNELKSYGHLVLIKHDGGWVTAYAHNGSILVKKGDKIRRGQAIARSGQSGEVNKPQLHFEIRRGALAKNPKTYLSSN